MDLTRLLDKIPPSELDYQEWLSVGMALKHEGYSCDVWDSWSQGDKRYKTGECSRKWETFREGTSNIVTGGTIYEMAQRFGYSEQQKEVRIFDWNDEIEYDGDPDVVVKDSGWLDTTANAIDFPSNLTDRERADQLRRFIQRLFKDDEIVGYCVESQRDDDGKYHPAGRGVYGMTAGQILESIKKYADKDEGFKQIIGDYNTEAGAWIRFNPLDGAGISNANVTDLRYALVESDVMDLEKQRALMKELQLPIAVMMFSGGKSIHAIVKIGAVTENDYREKVDYLYRVCEKNGLKIDKQNKNQSRMTRMPGARRGKKEQFIIEENLGLSSFDEWKEYIESSIDNFPDIINFDELDAMPELSPELIEGMLRQGHKMLISGASKAGKSFLLIELAISVASGGRWLGFKCVKGRVLYVNLEVDGNSFLNRVNDVKTKIEEKYSTMIKLDNLDIWNLRGERAEISKLAPRLIRRAKSKGYSMIVLDPLYKLNEGDENSASDMAKFFNHLDYICKQLGVSIVCCHHHSKGAQGGKFSVDRASGSGVFARDPDALLDMIQINPKDAGMSLEPGESAWRISSTLREFPVLKDIDVIFSHPLHEITEDLKEARPISGQDSMTNSRRGNAAKSDKRDDKYERLLSFVENWPEIDQRPEDKKTPHPTLGEAVEYFKNDRGFSGRSIRRWIEENDDDVFIQNGLIILRDHGDNDDENCDKTQKTV